MSDAFLPGNGFDTYEEQDRVLMGLSGSVRSGVAVRILQQQGFAVAAAVVRLCKPKLRGYRRGYTFLCRDQGGCYR